MNVYQIESRRAIHNFLRPKIRDFERNLSRELKSRAPVASGDFKDGIRVRSEDRGSDFMVKVDFDSDHSIQVIWGTEGPYKAFEQRGAIPPPHLFKGGRQAAYHIAVHGTLPAVAKDGTRGTVWIEESIRRAAEQSGFKVKSVRFNIEKPR